MVHAEIDLGNGQDMMPNLTADDGDRNTTVFGSANTLCERNESVPVRRIGTKVPVPRKLWLASVETGTMRWAA